MKKILLVDDHPLIVEGYRMALQSNETFAQFCVFEKAFDCTEAKQKIDQAIVEKEPYDLALVDFSLPKGQNSIWEDGGDIIRYIKKEMPSCRTVTITGHTEILTIYDIVKNIRPTNIIGKNEITPQVLIDLVSAVLRGDSFQSPLVKKCLEEMVFKEVMYDDYNRAILILLAKGYKLIDLEHHVPLSAPTIKKRIAKMKAAFGSPDSATLVQDAIKQGFV
ncbi:response regulator [Myroides sp. WP-1]|uniref:response regulator n=1 Tax=Myroides sp. WP-1 TaxID=2759944 RepID=UPI0015F90BC7|nr:response regulator [Myroides sp. WP-1]MBB1140215.1 response regulator [Myroides sp. WP-1]